ncbi:hypothetical protein M0R45_002321 [Rubus argutus]|uniref:Uncharacterized protein n=1 Tax=Rubus argutus TaxID=59490 RepID=A0AAW1VHM5_RUBAR
MPLPSIIAPHHEWASSSISDSTHFVPTAVATPESISSLKPRRHQCAQLSMPRRPSPPPSLATKFEAQPAPIPSHATSCDAVCPSLSLSDSI